MKNTMKKLLALLLALVLTLALAACGQKEENKTDDQTNDPAITDQDNAADKKVTLPVADGAVIGQGAVAFTVEVQGADGKTVTFTVNTDEETVGAALLKLGVIAGDDSEYGLYVKTVNGETADYDTDGTYWGFYINGEYAMTRCGRHYAGGRRDLRFPCGEGRGLTGIKKRRRSRLFFIPFPVTAPHRPADTGSRSRRLCHRAACPPAFGTHPPGWCRRPLPACHIAAGRPPALRRPAHGDCEGLQ